MIGAREPALRPPAPREVALGGLFGDMLGANRRGRLAHFITGPESPAIGIFAAAHKAHNEEGDWYGEHAGKWLIATARAVAAGDETLRAPLERVADWLIEQQDDDGYLGTYAPARRFMVPQPPKPESWNGEPALRTWDIWIASYLVLGLIETQRALGTARHLDAAERIADLVAATLARGIDLTSLGNHHGMSATVFMDAAMELYRATGSARHLELARRVLGDANANPRLALVPRALAGEDASAIATGKAYQLAWNLVGLAKLWQATGEADLGHALQGLWQSIRTHHLTLGGGPRGGVAHRSREVFNAPGSFFPEAYVETCSVLAWIELNRELLEITGEARYAEEIERAAYNDLLGAMAPDGEDWCYYTYANGRRVHTTYWRCCKSSGAMAVEELTRAAYGVTAQGALKVNLYGAGVATLAHPRAGRVELRQSTRYPFDGVIRIEVTPERAAQFSFGVRIPEWADAARIGVNGDVVEAVRAADGYAVIEREWRAGDVVTLDFPMSIRIHRAANVNVQESRAPDGSPVAQEVLRHEYLALTRGPLVYATPLIDGYKLDETLKNPIEPHLRLELGADAGEGAPILMHLDWRDRPIIFEPWYRCGGRVHGAWRLTWLALAPSPLP